MKPYNDVDYVSTHDRQRMIDEIESTIIFIGTLNKIYNDAT